MKIELRFKTERYEVFAEARVPEKTDASQLLRTIGASSLIRTEEMPFSGTMQITGEFITSGELRPGLYTVYGPLGVEKKAQSRLDERYHRAG